MVGRFSLVPQSVTCRLLENRVLRAEAISSRKRS